ncbi:MAG: GGDEF domain-containing protein [Lachnospiraceae bacterium]|nr:GGDEF domain-containing protein [Lachnospiraceae bacterium]
MSTLDKQKIEAKTEQLIYKFIHSDAHRDDYAQIYEMLGAVKASIMLQYDNDPMTRSLGPEFVIQSERESDGSIVLFENGMECGERFDFDYTRPGERYLVCTLYMRAGLELDDEDRHLIQNITDRLFLLRSITNMRNMLDFARNHDAQSGILNGVGIRASYREAITANPDVNYVVLYINIQNFKYINERASTRVGDEAIIQYARRLTTQVEADEGVGRLGGDNFVLYVRRENLDKIIHKLSLFVIDDLQNAPGKKFTLSAWVGVSADDTDEDIATRIEHASIANMFGKQRLKQPVVFYSEKFTEMLDNSRRIASLFMPALSKHEFHAYFQAKVDMASGNLVGFETLCRWIHDGEFTFPDQFIPVIDRLGLIHELDMEILRLTCESIKKWREMGLQPPILSVNFSRKDIFIPNIEKEIFDMVSSFDIHPGDIEIEITETASESEYERVMSFTSTLKDMGFRIAIDDFGTGYSSLSLIHNINADVLKIDKSFVTSIQESSKTEVLVESIITIAKKLDMEIVAEGVETAEEGMRLMQLGCSTAQGFYYSRPSDFEHTTRTIQEDPFKPIGEQ